MKPDGPAMLASRRAAERELRKVGQVADNFLLANSNKIGFDSYAGEVARICEEGFESAAFAAARTLAALKRQRALAMSENLRAALSDAEIFTLEIFDRNDGSGSLYPRPAATRTDLVSRLDEIAVGICEDLATGVYHVPETIRPGSTTINFHGAATNVAIATDGSLMTIEGGQNSSTGMSLDQLVGALDEIEEGLRARNPPQAELDADVDVLINARREIEAPAPDAGRLKRFFKAAGDVALKVGASAAGGVIARFLQIKMGM